MKNFERIGLTLFLLAGGMAVAKDYFDFPWLSGLAGILFGLVAIVASIQIFSKGEAIEGKSSLSDKRYVVRFTGVSATLVAIFLLMGGLFISGLGVFNLFGNENANDLMSNSVGSPLILGIIIGLVGLMIAVYGSTRLLSGSGTTPGAYSSYIEFGFRVGGALSVLVGLAMILLALGLIIMPDTIISLVDTAWQSIQRLVLQ